MKQYIKYFLLIFILLLCKNVKAYTIAELVNYSYCSNGQYSLAHALSDGSLTGSACYNTYAQAKTVMDAASDDDLVIIYNYAGATKVIDAKYAIAKLDKGNVTTNIYPTSSLASAYTYMNNSSSYGGVDGAFSGFDNNYKSARVTISGYTGYVNESSHKLVPLSWAKSTNIYYVTAEYIKHCYTTNIENTLSSSPMCNTLGLKPDMLAIGTYYSYDGKYFYTNLKTMLTDYKNNTRNNAYNASSPYYNYYMWLPLHSKSNYSATDLNNYIRSTLGYIGKSYGSYNRSGYSMFYGEGSSFYESQEYYGINMLTTLGVARNESASGRSSYAINRNNLFGHNAVDSNPSLATYYLNIRTSIYEHAQYWMTYGYLEPTDWRFYGSILGNKANGINVQYASDPYWGEKAASYYYWADKALGMQDYNYYQIAVTNTSAAIYPKVAPNPSSANIYSGYYYDLADAAVLVIGEEMGTDGKLWYKIMSDMNQNVSKSYISNQSMTSKYDWSYNYAYVPAQYFTKVNTKSSYVSPLNVYNYNYPSLTYTVYQANNELSPKLGNIKNTTTVYYSSLLDSSKGVTIPANAKVIVHEATLNASGETISYLVTYEYSTTQKEWVSASDVEIINNAVIGKTTLSDLSTTQNVRSTASTSGTIVGSLPSASYVGVIEDKVVSGVTWAKIYYNNGTTGWIVTNYDGCTLAYNSAALTINYPVISATDQMYLLGSTIDYKKDATATDIEDGNLTSNIEVISNNVNVNVVGTYQVTYRIIDSDSNTTTKTINIVITDYIDKSALSYFQSLVYQTDDTYEVSGFIAIAGMNNNTDAVKQTLILKNVATNVDYRFNLTNWSTGYPFEFSNVDDDKPYDYSKGWFKTSIDLSSTTLPEGDYVAYIEVINGVYKTTKIFNNLGYREMTRRKTLASGRGVYIEMDYYQREAPLVISLRDAGLISDTAPISYDTMFNFFTNLNFIDNKLSIKGTSHNVGIDYGITKEVSRQIIFENTTDYTRYTYDVGAITTGDYVVELRAPDGFDKTQTWYEASLDIKDLPKGTYAIYVKTGVGSFFDYGELVDLSYRTFNQTATINSKDYSLIRVDTKRFRMELVIE